MDAPAPAGVVIGIDPGLRGALAVLDGDGARVWDTPMLDGGYLTGSMVRLLREAVAGSGTVPVVAALEDGIAMPKQSCTATATQFRGIGLWEGLLAAEGIGYELVPPARWVKDLGLTRGGRGCASSTRSAASPHWSPRYGTRARTAAPTRC